MPVIAELGSLGQPESSTTCCHCRTCGKCRWWQQIDDWSLGMCAAPLPLWAGKVGDWIRHRKEAAERCKAFSPREPEGQP